MDLFVACLAYSTCIMRQPLFFCFDMSICKVIFDVCLGSKKPGDLLTLQINISKVYFSTIDTYQPE